MENMPRSNRKTKVRHRRLVVLGSFSTPQSNELSETTLLLAIVRNKKE